MPREYYESICILSPGKYFQFSLWPNKICDELKCTSKIGIPLSYLDWFGYKCWLYCDREADEKGLPINEIGSQLIKEKGPVYGPVIITDEEQDLTVEMFEEMQKIANIVPLFIWQPEKAHLSVKLSGIAAEYFKYQTQQYNDAAQALDKKAIMKKLSPFIPSDLLLTRLRF